MNQDAVFQQAGLAHLLRRDGNLVDRVRGVLQQIHKALGRGRYTNHHRHLHQPHFRVAQQKTLHQRLRSLRPLARGHAPVRLVDHHEKPVRNRQRRVGQRLPDQMLAPIAPVGQWLVDGEFLRVDEVDAPAVQAGRVEMRIDGNELVDPVHLVGFALDLEPGLLVEFGHVRYPQNYRIGLRRPIQRPRQFIIRLVKNSLEQRRHHDGLAAARGGRKRNRLRLLAARELARGHDLVAQQVQRIALKIKQRDFHARAPCVSAWPAARPWC